MEHQRKPPTATATVRDDSPLSPNDQFAAATRSGAVEVPYRHRMEVAFGTDFGDVRAFVGRREIAELGPEAITRGNDIAFASANPSVELVAHEIAHVVQNRRHGTRSGGAMSSPDDAAEREADDIATRIATGEKISVVGAAPSAELSLRGPAFAGSNEQELAKYGLRPGDVVLVLDDPDGTKITKEELRARGEQRVRIQVGTQYDTLPACLLDIDSFHLSPDPDHDDVNTQGGHEQSRFSPPEAYDVDDEHVYAQWTLYTKNQYDRAAFDVRFPESPTETLYETKASYVDEKQWNNPAWDPTEMHRDARFAKYGFIDGFTGLPGHGDGHKGVERTIKMKIPRKHAPDGVSSTSSTIAVGMKVFYDDNGPTVATDKESLAAYGKQRQYHGWGVYKNELGQARINLEKIGGKAGVAEGEYASPEEVWARPLGENPSPNIVRPFPASYTEKHPKAAPLRAEGKDFALATRIENEATLSLSSKGALQELVTMLATLSEQPALVQQIMSKDPLLAQFEWSLHKENGGDPMLFTDKYMDDRRHVALRSGVGIRRRSTTKATKLNIKTGEGYNVGKVRDHDGGGYDTDGEPSDVYRRHEVGFDIDPTATPQQIGEYLHSGLSGDDPWNIGGREANKTTQEKLGENIDFTDLAYRVVLQGHRTKFRLEAKKDGGTINIELSCDHTVGRTFEDFEKDPDAEVHAIEGKYHHIYNLEMELEHLGASTLAQQRTSEESPKSESPSESESKPQTKGPSTSPRVLPPRPDHPGRNYLRDDTRSPAFNTPSFQVFAHAKDRFIQFAREEYKEYGGVHGLTPPESGQQLEKAPQKLEALYRAMDLRPSQHEKPVLGKLFHRFTQGFKLVESQHDDTMCAALQIHTRLPLEELQKAAPATGDSKERLAKLASFTKRKIILIHASGTKIADYGVSTNEVRVVKVGERYHALVKE